MFYEQNTLLDLCGKAIQVFFATINLSCLLSTWISFDLREKDASKTGEQGLRNIHKWRHLKVA